MVTTQYLYSDRKSEDTEAPYDVNFKLKSF